MNTDSPFLIRPRSGVHFDFDAAGLDAIYAGPFDEDDLVGDFINGASSVYQTTRSREKYDYTGLPEVPCDVFLWSIGASERRDGTRFGGVPFLPASTPWPAGPDGPMTFVCQIDFRDSRDLVPATPGDLLLVFARDRDAYLDRDEPGAYEFIWVDGAEVDCIDPAAAPAPAFPFVECWGARYRWCDVPSGDLLDLPEDLEPELLSRLVATKIGGVPSQPIDGAGEAKFLCQIDSVQPVPHAPYPWLNVAEPVGYGSEPETEFMFGDRGSLFLFLEGDTVRIFG